MKTVYISRWADFVSHTDELEGWAFRGQRSASWPLVSTLTRRLGAFCPDPRLWPLREASQLVVECRTVGHVDVRLAPEHPHRPRLALMQHHGAATRLLDFTKSPFVAAFFALESAVSDVVVYALNTPALWSLTPGFDPSLTRDRVDPRLPGNFERYYAVNRLPVLWFGEPAEMDARLMAQSGLFVVPGVLDLPLDAILDGYGSSDELLHRIVLPTAVRQEAMRSLYRMNITYATLFPDLDGLALSVGYELEAIWPRLVEEYEQARPQNHLWPDDRAAAEGPAAPDLPSPDALPWRSEG